MRIEELIRENASKLGVTGSKYIISVLGEKDGMIHISVRSFRNNKTKEYFVKDNMLYPIE